MATPPTFTAGQVLTAAQMNKVGEWLVTSAAFTNVTTVSVNNCFTSDYRNYRIVVNLTQVQGAAAQEGQVLLRTGSTNSATNYYYARTGYSYAGVASNEVGNNTSRWFIGRSNGSGSADGENAFAITLYAPAATTRTWFVGSTADGSYAANVGGYHDIETAYDGFHFVYGNQTMSGVYYVYGLVGA